MSRVTSLQLQRRRVAFLSPGAAAALVAAAAVAAAAAAAAAAGAAAAAAAKVFSSRRGACELGSDECVRCSGVSLHAEHLEAGSAPR